jgi:hypothetical protein
MSKTDDKFGEDDAEFAAWAEEFDSRCRALYELVSQHMDREEIDEEYAAQMLTDIAVRMRMIAYGIGVEKPSAGGLKLDLDRFRQEVDHLVRDAKKGAEKFISELKVAQAAAEREADETP